MKVTYAYLCLTCEEVFHRAPQGRCPVRDCRSEDIAWLGWLRQIGRLSKPAEQLRTRSATEASENMAAYLTEFRGGS